MLSYGLRKSVGVLHKIMLLILVLSFVLSSCSTVPPENIDEPGGEETPGGDELGGEETPGGDELGGEEAPDEGQPEKEVIELPEPPTFPEGAVLRTEAGFAYEGGYGYDYFIALRSDQTEFDPSNVTFTLYMGFVCDNDLQYELENNRNIPTGLYGVQVLHEQASFAYFYHEREDNLIDEKYLCIPVYDEDGKITDVLFNYSTDITIESYLLMDENGEWATSGIMWFAFSGDNTFTEETEHVLASVYMYYELRDGKIVFPYNIGMVDENNPEKPCVVTPEFGLKEEHRAFLDDAVESEQKYGDKVYRYIEVDALAYKSEKSIFDISDVTLDFSIGTELFNTDYETEHFVWRNIPTFEISFENDDGEKIIVKTVEENYISEKYRCVVSRDAVIDDYWNLDFAYTEAFTIPAELFTKTEGTIIFRVRGSDINKKRNLNACTEIQYKVLGDKVVLFKTTEQLDTDVRQWWRKYVESVLLK